MLVISENSTVYQQNIGAIDKIGTNIIWFISYWIA